MWFGKGVVVRGRERGGGETAGPWPSGASPPSAVTTPLAHSDSLRRLLEILPLQELLPPTARGRDLFRPWAARPAKAAPLPAARSATTSSHLRASASAPWYASSSPTSLLRASWRLSLLLSPFNSRKTLGRPAPCPVPRTRTPRAHVTVAAAVAAGDDAASAAAAEADDAERPTPPMLPLMPRGTARRRRGDADAGVGWVYSV